MISLSREGCYYKAAEGSHKKRVLVYKSIIKKKIRCVARAYPTEFLYLVGYKQFESLHRQRSLLSAITTSNQSSIVKKNTQTHTHTLPGSCSTLKKCHHIFVVLFVQHTEIQLCKRVPSPNVR